MRGAKHGAARIDPEADGLLVLLGCVEDAGSIQAWARLRGLAVEEREWPPRGAVPTRRPIVMQVVEWRADATHQDFAAMNEADCRFTLFVVNEGVELDPVSLDLGHEWDFVQRPYSFREFVWRAERALARPERLSAVRPRDELVRGPLTLAEETGEIRLAGAVLSLRRSERDVLSYLMRNAHRFTTCRELQENVLHSHGDGSAARNQVYELRRKLRAAGEAGAIVTRTHQGYRLLWSY